MYILPHVETLGGFWVVFATGTAVAAWVNFGSPRVSYGGYQVGLAFYKILLQGWGPVTALTVARDRIVGVALGLLVFGVLERVLWPVSASERRERRFVDVLRSLAALARLGSRDRAQTGPDRELDDQRHQVAHALGETQRLLDESKFELGVGELEAFQRRLGDVQIVFLLLLSLVYHWRTHGRPAPALQFGEAVARHLDALAASHRRARPISRPLWPRSAAPSSHRARRRGGPPAPASNLWISIERSSGSSHSSSRGGPVLLESKWPRGADLGS